MSTEPSPQPPNNPTTTTTDPTSTTPPEDPFAPLLSLEEQYHTEGRTLGLAEGAATGQIEGRVFGLEKSFEKFIELGRLGGRGAVWSARLPAPAPAPAQSTTSTSASAPIEVGKEDSPRLGPLLLPGSGSERLARHVRRLVELTDADDVSRENSEEGVQDFDDRLREAKGKGVLVERLVGEGGGGGRDSAAAGAAGGGHAGNSTVKRAGVKPGNAQETKAKSGEMEDFLGLPRGVKTQK